MATQPSPAPISRRAVLAGGAAALPLALGITGVTAQAEPLDVATGRGFVIQPRSQRQTIRGFGGMTHTAWIGDLTPSQRDTAFDNGPEDLGLTILRIPVPEDRANWSRDLETAQVAAAKGALVFASPWNPPAELVELFVKTDPPKGSQYEAEQATLTDAQVATGYPGYQGEGYVQLDDVAGAGIEITGVVIGSTGRKNLAFRYTSPGRDVLMDVWVAGALVAERVVFAGTAEGEWSWTSVQADMVPGQWPVRIATSESSGLAIDYMMAAGYTPPEESRRLRHDAYGAYAQHLNDFVLHMRDNGVELYAISIQNEPDYAHDWTWWTTDEMLRFLRDFAPQIDCRIIAPESFQYVKDVSDPILQDPAALANTDILGAHLYGTALEDFPYPLFEEKGEGKELWMTELYYPNSSSSANLWPEALGVATHVHHAMADAEFQTYVWWYIRRYYGPILEDGSISKRGYMLAHFTKFVRPGDIRVEAPKEPQVGVFTSAYLGQDGRLVVVAVNSTTAEASQHMSVQGRRVRRVQSWLTDATRDLQEQPDLAGQGTAFTATLPPESVTTFVLT
jgi:glucuronoarabinoxylan endo-1,4-beta-xylanase